MKNLLVILTLFLTSSAFAQKIYTRNDSIPITKDSVTFQAGPHKGNIQWQKTLDNTNWINLEGKTTDSIKVKSNVEAMYRAKIIEGTCLPVYSDSVAIVTHDSISKNFILPDKLGLVLVSDSLKLSKGNYIYTGAIHSPAIDIGQIIIDKQAGGTLRMITNTYKNGDTLRVETKQATMQDLFYNTSFKLSTEAMTPSESLKNASFKEIQKALTDDKGFIHPASIICIDSDGKVLKNASIFSNDKMDQGGSLYIHHDWSGLQIYNFSGGWSAPNIGGAVISYNGNAKATIQEGYFTFDPIFKFEIDYKRPKIDWKNFSLNAGELKTFKFYTDSTSLMDFKNIIAFESNTAFELGKEFPLGKSIDYYLLFPVGGVPVWIDFQISVKCGFKETFGSGGIYTTQGFQNTDHFAIGATYVNKQWSTIKKIKSENQDFATNTEFSNLGIKFYVNPSINIKLYSVIGPFFKVGPYMNYELTASINKNWDRKLAVGLDETLGVSVEVLGDELYSLNAENYKYYEKILFNSPAKIMPVSGENQTALTGKTLANPIVVKVIDSKNHPIKNVQVYYNPVSGTVENEIIRTDSVGLAQTKWTLSESSGRQRLEVYILDGKDEEIDTCSFTAEAIDSLNVNFPIVTTKPVVTNISTNSATSGGFIPSDGGTPITARGVVWSTSPNPIILNIVNNNITSDGTGIGVFTSNITGLTPNTTYFVRAYATNSAGTAYGNELTFVTKGTVDEVVIGTQTWMTKNLNVSTYRNGDPIMQVTDTATLKTIETGAWCYYRFDSSKGAVYGKLYNAYAVTDPRGLAPAGWHIPRESDWNKLIAFLGPPYEGSAQDARCGASGWINDVAEKIMEAGNSHWLDAIFCDFTANNSSGFTALPGGMFNPYWGDDGFGVGDIGYYSSEVTLGAWWSYSPPDDFKYYYINPLYGPFLQITNHVDGFEHYGFMIYVRCVKD